jgi:hypothetical protein
MVTRRCTQRQLLLRPDLETTNAFIYCLALAAKGANMGVVAFLAHSNHHHTIVVDTDGRMPEFLERFHKLVAKHQNALRGRWENFWASEATSVVELDEADDILAKMTYVLTNPVKDKIVSRADQWPGATSRRANLEGGGLDARRPHRFFRKDGELPERVTLSCVRPPGFEHLAAREWRSLLDGRIRRSRRQPPRNAASGAFRSWVAHRFYVSGRRTGRDRRSRGASSAHGLPPSTNGRASKRSKETRPSSLPIAQLASCGSSERRPSSPSAPTGSVASPASL